MQRSPVLSPDGRAVFVAGGNAWRQRVYKGLILSFEWVTDGSAKRRAPCLCIWKDAPRIANVTGRHEDNGIWNISRRNYANFLGTRSGHEFKVSGDPSPLLWNEAREALTILGFDRNDKQALKNLVDAVLYAAEDFNRMPVTPTELLEQTKRPMWEVTALNKSTGKVISESEV